MNDNLLQIIESLKQSKFRSRFKFREKDLAYIREKRLETIKDHAVDFITSRISDASPENDGKQNPMKNHPRNPSSRRTLRAVDASPAPAGRVSP